MAYRTKPRHAGKGKSVEGGEVRHRSTGLNAQDAAALWELVRSLSLERDQWKHAYFDRGLLPLRDQTRQDLERLLLAEHLIGQTEPESYGLNAKKGRATKSFLLQHLRSSANEVRRALDVLDAEMLPALPTITPAPASKLLNK